MLLFLQSSFIFLFRNTLLKVLPQEEKKADEKEKALGGRIDGVEGEINDINEALSDVDYFTWPVIVKPVDSAGSKGVTRVDNPANLRKAIEFALLSSISKRFIIEDFLEKEGFSVGSESFVVDGKLVYNAFYD